MIVPGALNAIASTVAACTRQRYLPAGAYASAFLCPWMTYVFEKHAWYLKASVEECLCSVIPGWYYHGNDGNTMGGMRVRKQTTGQPTCSVEKMLFMRTVDLPLTRNCDTSEDMLSQVNCTMWSRNIIETNTLTLWNASEWRGLEVGHFRCFIDKLILLTNFFSVTFGMSQSWQQIITD